MYLEAIERGFNTPEVYRVAELCRQTDQDGIALEVLRTMAREFSDNMEVLSYTTASFYDEAGGQIVRKSPWKVHQRRWTMKLKSGFTT